MTDKKKYVERDEFELAYHADMERYVESSYADDYTEFSQPQLVGHMMLIAHSLEKGLASDNFEPGRGFPKVKQLAKMIQSYQEKSYDMENSGYKNSLATLSAIVDIHTGTRYEKDVHLLVSDVLSGISNLDEIEKQFAGVKRVKVSEKINNDKKNFEELSEGRSSVRTFSDKPVRRSDIKDAIKIAQKSPSACNRQASRVYEIYDPEIIKEIMIIQEGFRYQTAPQSILLVVADDNNFSGVGERNQGYVDGGMFAMSLMYALEYKKLASCPLHASFTYEREQLLRATLNIPNSQKLIVFLAVGNFKNDFVVAKSYRYPVDLVTSEITEIKKPITRDIDVTPVSKDDEIINKIQKRISEMKKKLRIRTRIRNVLAAKKQDKFFFLVYLRLQRVSRTKSKRIYLFGAPRHRNLGDQAQTVCIEDWCKKHYPKYKVIVVDTHSGMQNNKYIINKVRSIIKKDDKIILQSGYHTTDIWKFENDSNLEIIKKFPDFRIFVFPQTINFSDEDYLKKTVKTYEDHGDVLFMCRDDKSYDMAKKMFKKINVVLMPDVVTSLIGTFRSSSIGREGINMCFRNDKESKYGNEIEDLKGKLGSVSNEIILTDTTVKMDPYYIVKHRKKAVLDHIRMMSKNKLTVTDRYHGTIFSIIANTPVIVLGSTDHKLSSGVRWFSDKMFSELVYYADSPKEAVRIAKEIYGKYDYGNFLPDYFNNKYWDKIDLK